MGRRLAGTVVLRSPETGEPVALLAGDDVPDWAAEAITNPDLWEDGSEPDEGAVLAEPAGAAGGELVAETVPPMPIGDDGIPVLTQPGEQAEVAGPGDGALVVAEPAEAAPVKRSASRSSK